MPTMNVVLDISSPPAGLVPWRWDFYTGGSLSAFVADTNRLILGSPLMKETANPSNIIRARTTLGEVIYPVDILDMFREDSPPTPVPGRPEYTFYPCDGFVCGRHDLNERDAALLFPSTFPFDITMTLQRLPSIYLTVQWNVTAVNAKQTGDIDYYNLDATPSNPVWTGQHAVQSERYFDGDPVILTIQESDVKTMTFMTYGEIITAETGFEVTIAGEGDTVPSQTVDVRVRYNPNIEAGYLATLDGDTYTITGVEITERYRYMRLSLTRYVTS